MGTYERALVGGYWFDVPDRSMISVGGWARGGASAGKKFCVRFNRCGRVAQLVEQCPFNSLLQSSYLADSITSVGSTAPQSGQSCLSREKLCNELCNRKP